MLETILRFRPGAVKAGGDAITSKIDVTTNFTQLGEIEIQTNVPAGLRRRGTFDFPVLGLGVCVSYDAPAIRDVRIRIGGAGSHPVAATAFVPPSRMSTSWR